MKRFGFLVALAGLAAVGCGELDPDVGAVREGATAEGICAAGDSDPGTAVTYTDVLEQVFGDLFRRQRFKQPLATVFIEFKDHLGSCLRFQQTVDVPRLVFVEPVQDRGHISRVQLAQQRFHRRVASIRNIATDSIEKTFGEFEGHGNSPAFAKPREATQMPSARRLA